ncbi:uncharacterized protein MYCFIDRAFT_81620 [Pseudocercospora fijiensis CIRAD86]|uniref:Uncharacterized protein n=1 Tax=Pseudocercospora fijiensis (strain CIRAD86) TaxID=383855 RepID=M3AG15_PSEFD|nr:uncharacterized protein MYCFIDRAFT_81620 [Pseudocercospora fijiensis CIRAD86]EME83531.1 hypothetical protein MYCFIDRAFT_81620 [Pseudocercospora fijiensis CIRAD86]
MDFPVDMWPGDAREMTADQRMWRKEEREEEVLSTKYFACNKKLVLFEMLAAGSPCFLAWPWPWPNATTSNKRAAFARPHHHFVQRNDGPIAGTLNFVAQTEERLVRRQSDRDATYDIEPVFNVVGAARCWSVGTACARLPPTTTLTHISKTDEDVHDAGRAYQVDAHRQILSKAPQPSHYPSSDGDGEGDDDDDSSADEAVTDDDDDDDDDAVEETEGPNHRGTYSKDYVLKHPEIEFIHRGQGRYLPVSELKPDPVISSPRPTRSSPLHPDFQETMLTKHLRHSNSRTATTSDTTDMMYQALAQEIDDHRRKHNPAAREKRGPALKHQFNLICDLFKNTPRSDWLKACDQIKDVNHREVARKWVKAMEREFPSPSTTIENSHEARARPSRQAKSTSLAAVPSIEHRRSSRLVDAPSNYDEGDEEVDDSDVSDSPDRTFTRDYVDAHPKEQFYHTGNGYYRRGSRTMSMTRSKRRESSHSQAVKYSSSDAEEEVEEEVDEEETVKGDELYKYPGIIFHHKGNSYYKRGVAPNGRRGTFVVGANGEKVPYDPNPKTTTSDRHEVKLLRKASVTSLDLEPNGTVRREFTEQHPQFEWTHVGGGWFRRKHSNTNVLNPAFTTPTASSERRSSRVSTNFSRDDPESHISDEMTRTSERRKRASRNDAGDDMESLNGSQSRMKPPHSISRSDSSELFDLNYVNLHPDEVFHHRGQGRWARGLPPPGSSNKIAVRGPVDEAERNDRPVNEHGEVAPLPTALVRREEGPDKWPQLRWVYRGGGKWCQKTKEEIEADARAALAPPHKKQRTSIGSRPKGAGAGAEAQVRREAKANKGKAPASKHLLKAGKIVRKRSQQSVLLGGDTSKASSGSQSKAPTPKPVPLSEELDKLTAEDLPSFWKDEWSEDEKEDADDEATKWLREPANGFRPIKGWQAMVAAMEKYAPGSRSLGSLKALAANAQSALKDIQDEFLLLDQVVARNPIKGNERNPVKGGRVAVSHEIWEDKKESTLYDYVFDAKKIGFQDPDAQKIVRDAEGRELRRRRNNRKDIHATQVDYGDGEMTGRRTIKPVSRFDGVIMPAPRKRSRMRNAGDGDDVTPSMTPERGNTPSLSLAGTTNNADGGFVAATRGRWAGHVPKRIRELRGESVSSQRSASPDSASPQPGQIRKGRPPGSKNHHKRKDAGIKKGPRKPKVSSDPQQGDVVPEQSVTATKPPPSIPPPDPMSLDAIISPQPASA